MLLTKLIENGICNALVTYELVEVIGEFDDSYVVLHRAQLQPTTATDFMIECSLDDCDVREHFEALLTANCHGYPAHTFSEVA